jgi:hypothetical protein
MRWIVLSVLFAHGAGCATTPTAGMCPEARKVRCMTRMVCSRDASRGCQMCTCEPANLFPDRTREERSGEALPGR